MKYTINDLKEGRIIVYKDVSNEDMTTLLKHVFPNDTDEYTTKRYINNHTYFKRSKMSPLTNYIFICKYELCSTDIIVNASELLLQIKDNEIENNELNKLNDMKSKIFSIEGSNTLKKAFVEEIGFKLLSSDSINYKFLTNWDRKDKTLQGTPIPKQPNFVLPKDWNKAIEFVKNLDKPEDIVVDGYTAEFFTDTSDNYVRFGCHIISLSELQAIKTVMNLRKKLEYNQINFNATGVFPVSVNSHRLLSEETVDKLIERLSK